MNTTKQYQFYLNDNIKKISLQINIQNDMTDKYIISTHPASLGHFVENAATLYGEIVQIAYGSSLVSTCIIHCNEDMYFNFIEILKETGIWKISLN
jgi:hypothetical protein